MRKAAGQPLGHREQRVTFMFTVVNPSSTRATVVIQRHEQLGALACPANDRVA
jgi:hypothetical protein